MGSFDPASHNGSSRWTKRKKTLSVPEAGRRYFDLSRNGSYVAVRLGLIPVIKLGKKLRVPVMALERMLQEARPLIPGEDE